MIKSISLSFLLAISSIMHAEEIPFRKLIDRIQIIGDLGVSIGSVVQIDGKVGEEMDNKALWERGENFIIVNMINNKPLNPVVTIRVSNSDRISLRKFDFEYGKLLKVIGYEHLEMVGRPNDLNKLYEFPQKGGVNYQSSTIFIPLEIIDR